MDKPRGRGAALAQLLKKHTESKPGGEVAEEQIPAKSRGRAAILKKLQDQLEQKAGGGDQDATKLTRSEASVSSSRGVIESVTQSLKSMSIVEQTTSEVTSFAGQSGTPISCTANYIKLEVEKDRGLYQYEVRFHPEVDSRSYRFKIVSQALGPSAAARVYDGDVFLYLPSQALDDRTEVDCLLPNTEEPVKVTMTFKKKQRMSECLHLYNVLLKRIMNILLYKRMGRNYFDLDHKYIIPHHKLEVLPGFAVHVDEMEGGLMICLDTQHRVIRTQTVYELFNEIRAANPRSFKEDLKRQIIGACVLTKYNNQTYIVDDISFEMTPQSTFMDRKSGTDVTFIDYYKQQYGINIDDRDQPLLLTKKPSGKADKQDGSLVCLIPEVCHLTGLSDAMRDDTRVMKDVAAFTRVTPNQRLHALRTYLQNVNESVDAQKVLSAWGLRLAETTTNITGRVLPPETILFGGPPGRQGKCAGKSDWNRAITENKITGPIDLFKWQLYFTKRDQTNAQTFAQTMIRLAPGMGCTIREPQYILLNGDQNNSYMTAIKDNLDGVTDIQVAVFICPSEREDRYSIIKKMCCVNYPIASQVILSKTLKNPAKVRTIIHKIALQITCKLGGSLWQIPIPVNDWMVCGIDAWHGANQKSVCGFVCTINEDFTRYYNEAIFQDGEIGDFYKIPLRKALLAHKNRVGDFPKKLIVFRDGVGDGQLEHCKRYEITQFEEVFKELNTHTLLTFVIVQKRINTRLFQSVKGNCENPPSGTVVDTMVTRRCLPDFFLVPQSVRQGTVNPTHYIVLQDNSCLKPDHLQRLAYKLCHLYYNWSGTVRVPAPCLYAHKLASLVGQAIRKNPSSELNDKLYFL